MTVNINSKEQILLDKARLLSEDQLDKLLSFLDTIVVRSSPTVTDEFWELSKRASREAQDKGLTHERLQDILREIDENRR